MGISISHALHTHVILLLMTKKFLRLTRQSNFATDSSWVDHQHHCHSGMWSGHAVPVLSSAVSKSIGIYKRCVK